MKKMISGWILVWAALLVGLGILIPGILVSPMKEATGNVTGTEAGRLQKASQLNIAEVENSLLVPVFMTREEKVIELPLETYVSGVVAAEMPPEFELEALKAQAIAARTYIVNKAMTKDFSNVPVEGAWVTDTVAHQAFFTTDAIKQNWGIWKTARFLEKVYQAVKETSGLIMVYDGQPIDATFFSTSNGFTENSEDYWSQEIPYLRSVPSPWDKQLSPKYEQTFRVPLKEFYQKLSIKEVAVSSGAGLSMQILERTEGKRIKSVRIGDQIYSGREIREKLGLPSSHFQWQLRDKHVEIKTYGYGHGVGMSQYGAQGLAKEGYNAEQILKYYYKGIELKDWQDDPNIAKIKNL